jgi:ethanolamine utilization protein EutQ (cupin superfamily)
MSDGTMQVRKLTAADAEPWIKVGGDEIYVSDIIDQAAAPEAEMTVGFARVGKGEEAEISFPYDEVLILTNGAYTVRTESGDELTARAGEVIYLPAGSTNHSRAEEECEMVYVASPASVYAEHVAASAAQTEDAADRV